MRLRTGPLRDILRGPLKDIVLQTLNLFTTELLEKTEQVRIDYNLILDN